MFLKTSLNKKASQYLFNLKKYKNLNRRNKMIKIQ